MPKFHTLFTIAILACAVLAVACSQEEYGPCSIPNTVGHQAACTPLGDSKTATCAADYVFDCDSLICGIYESSDPFCTYRCVPSESECTSSDPAFCECPKGASCKSSCPEDAKCVEWIKGTSNYYCLPKEYDNSVNSSGTETDSQDTSPTTPEIEENSENTENAEE